MNLKRMKKEQLIGRKIRLLDAISNGQGYTIPAGSEFEIIAAHHGLNIRFKCQCCGLLVEITKIPRDAKYIELMQEDGKA